MKGFGFRPFAGALVLAVVVTVSLGAHHSFASIYDIDKPITVTGTVSKIQWSNPHVYFFIDVKGDTGTVTTWGFETAPITAIARQGWTRYSLKIGEVVTAEGYRARDGSNLASARLLITSDGRKLFAGSPGDGGPSK